MSELAVIYMTPQDKIVIKLFQDVAERVPAYKAFLQRNRIKPHSIQTIEDFKKIPLIDKKNYLTQFSLHDLSWDGNLFNSRIISVSSGSTGVSFFWPRGEEQDKEGIWMHEQIFKKIFGLDQGNTLVVVCFSMGTWIAGSFTTTSSMGVADRGYKINTVTPGLEQEEALKVIKELSPSYSRIVIAGYPPFVKDIIDEGYRQGINWKKLQLRFLWAGEAFSEEWRSYVLRRVNIRDPYFNAVNVYGTADAAMLGHETPVSILLRRIYNRRKVTTKKLFNTNILPSIVQYYPNRRYFESVDNELVFSARSGLPLVRYNIHDNGGVINYADIVKPVKKQFDKELRQFRINEHEWKLPFVYLNGRKDFTVTIYAVNVYPENIKAALVDPKMRSWVTGKFTMATKYYSDMDQYFEINIELAKGLEPAADYQIIARNTIINTLSKLNAEYHKLRASIGKKSDPHIHLIPFGDRDYFSGGVKHRWVKKID